MTCSVVTLFALLGARPAALSAQAERQVTCESRGDGFQYCDARTNGRVRLVKQLSSTRCVVNRTWGFDANGVWVDRGCRAQFAVGGSGPGTGWESGDYGSRISCESAGRDYKFCPIETRGDVRLVKQLSQQPCTAGRTWGFQRDGVWVTDGCRAQFEVGYADASWDDGQRTVTCESNDRQYTRCRAWTYGSVRLARQLSSAKCTQDRTWGYDREGVWVTEGCRGVFAIGTPQGGGGWDTYPGGNGNANAWPQLRQRAYDRCLAEARGRGYNGGRPQDAARRQNDDVYAALTAYRGGTSYRLNCLYSSRSNTARILDERPGTGGGQATQPPPVGPDREWEGVKGRAVQACLTEAGRQGYGSIRPADASPRGDGDAVVNLTAVKSSVNYRIGCLYTAKSAKAELANVQRQ